MTTNDISQWIIQSRAAGKTDQQIREDLRSHGWLASQIDIAMNESAVAPVRQALHAQQPVARESIGSARRAWVTMGSVLAVVVVAAALYFVNDRFDLIGGLTSSGDPVTNATLVPIRDQLAAQSTLKQFNDADELVAYLQANYSAGSYYGLSGSMARSIDAVGEAMPAPTSAVDDIGTSFGLGTTDLTDTKQSFDYSGTNLQVAGVDEADIVKTDGEYIYAVVQQKLYIVDAQPGAEAAVVATITFDDTPQDMFINGDRLVVFGADYSISEKAATDLVRSSSYTFLKIFDVTDVKNPVQLRDLDFEGYYLQSRMIENHLYLVTTQPANIAYDNPIPLILEEGKEMSTGTQPGLYYIDAPYQAQTFTVVSAVDIQSAEADVASEVILSSGAEQVYVSPTNLYLASTKYVNELQLTMDIYREVLNPRLNAEQRQQIKDIESAPNHVLSVDEKAQKIMNILTLMVEALSDNDQETLQKEVEQAVTAAYERIAPELEKTVIHRLSINKGSVTYDASGEVTGHLLNQFSMDESGGYFRIATTKSQTWLQFSSEEMESYSNVYVLDKDLEVVGRLEQLAKGEQIYSVRFMQNRAYLVTFQQTDPLFAIDLSDPRNPKVLGELKVPGFSSYLHPYDDNLLIGFGKQATDDGQVTGLKLSLFDVSDVTNLKEVDTYEFGDAGSDSIALTDHKAFLFDKEKNLLVIPVSLRTVTDDVFGSYSTHGAMVFSISPSGFEFRDRIDHSDGTADDNTIDYFYSYQYYDTMVKRSLYIDDLLYTVSNKYLKAHTLSDLKEVRTVPLGTSADDITIDVVR
ncbi:MAG: beta-propeller domain-containing protein [Candidatus Kerfeldbacteria bacterium]|nr:beta-propeller domain-containing protein [Candidatus Kerfeldbacteria bacterium]